MTEIIGNVFIVLGVIFMTLGVVGIFKFDNFYPRLLVASKVDTVGALTLSVGIMIRQGFGFFSAKVFLIMVILVILGPLVVHIIARSAYISGYRPPSVKKEE